MRLRPSAIGMTAHAAVVRAGGIGRILARLRASSYLTFGGEIVWLGGGDALLHPRAILVPGPPRLDDSEVELDVGALDAWRPPAPPAVSAWRLRAGWRKLAFSTLGPPGGFGALLTGRALVFPLDGARDAAEALARACAQDDAAAASGAAVALVGLGGGLTPSGDDYVGGAFFVRACAAAARADDVVRWRSAADRIRRVAVTRTHPISAALLDDLVGGAGWAPLHELVAALAAGRPEATRAAARRLLGLGHTSGWDVLAGVGAGLGALGDDARG